MQETPKVVTVVTSGTPVQALAAGPQACKVSVVNAAASGNAYVGIAGMNISTLVGVLDIVPAGGVRSLEDQGGANTIDTTQYWLDHGTSGSKVLFVYAQR